MHVYIDLAKVQFLGIYTILKFWKRPMMTKLDITKFSKYELNFKLLEKDSSGCSTFILSMFIVLHRAYVMALL